MTDRRSTRRDLAAGHGGLRGLGRSERSSPAANAAEGRVAACSRGPQCGRAAHRVDRGGALVKRGPQGRGRAHDREELVPSVHAGTLGGSARWPLPPIGVAARAAMVALALVTLAVGACRSAPTAETAEGLNESAIAERTVSLALEVQRAVVSALERHRDDPEAAAEALRAVAKRHAEAIEALRQDGPWGQAASEEEQARLMTAAAPHVDAIGELEARLARVLAEGSALATSPAVKDALDAIFRPATAPKSTTDATPAEDEPSRPGGIAIGLDMDRIRSDLEADKYAPRVQKDRADGLKIGVMGTPALYVIGERMGVALTADRLRARLDQALGE